MRSRSSLALAAVCLLIGSGSPLRAQEAAGVEDPKVGYARLVELFEEWRDFQQPRFRDGVPDYTAAAMVEQHRQLDDYRNRLAAIDPSGWPVAWQIDHRLVRAEMDGLDFDHRVLRPWARDPAFYAVVIDSESDTPLREGPVMAGAIELWRLAWPLAPAEVEPFRARLQAIPAILEQAPGNLLGDARDLWRLGIRTQQWQSAVLAELARYCDLAEVDIEDVIAEMDSVPVVRDLVYRDALGEEIYPNCVQLLKTFRKTEEYPNLVLAKMRLGSELMMDVGNIYTGALFAWLAAGIEEALAEHSKLAGEEILLVGYGSGDASEAIPVTLVEGWELAAAKIGFAKALCYRVDLTDEQYRQLHDDGHSPGLTYDHREEFLVESIGKREEKEFIDFGIEYYRYRGEPGPPPPAG